MMNKTYNVDEIFEEIPGDPDNILMNIPEEIRSTMGWEPGDTMIIKMENGGLIIQKDE